MCMMKSDGCDPSARGKLIFVDLMFFISIDNLIFMHSKLGLGYYGGACKHNVHNADLSTAFLEDSGGFNGIATAAHEIGHV